MPKGPVYSIVWPHYGSRYLSLGYVENGSMAIARQFGTGIVGTDSLWGKIVFINNGKTDLAFERAMMNLAQTDISKGENILIFRNMYIISSDITSETDGTAGKVLFTTSGTQEKIMKYSSKDKTELVSGDSKVVISHRMQENGNLNLQVADDIDLSDMEKIGWAIATRMNPQHDLEVKDNRIFMKAIRKHPEIPAIPENIMNMVRKKMRQIPDTD
jgi:3-polyprenyl-4-hydroxybenzoate decarboxylase